MTKNLHGDCGASSRALLTAGHVVAPIGRVYSFDQIVEAHAAMGAGGAAGKLVVTT